MNITNNKIRLMLPINKIEKSNLQNRKAERSRKFNKHKIYNKMMKLIKLKCT
jgi:hypothetical protein